MELWIIQVTASYHLRLNSSGVSLRERRSRPRQSTATPRSRGIVEPLAQKMKHWLFGRLVLRLEEARLPRSLLLNDAPRNPESRSPHHSQT